MTPSEYIENIKSLIARDNLNEALLQLQNLLKESPLLDEVIHQTARFSNIRKQVRMGEVEKEVADVTQNQIRMGILELLAEVLVQTEQHPDIKKEVEKAAVIIQQSAEKIYNINKIDKADFS
jgi:hypothetical protein